MRIVLSGGGTGGHITPILATAEALKQHEPQVELIYIGEGSEQEEQLLKGNGMRLERIVAGKWRRYPGTNLLSRLFDLKTLSLNLRDSMRVLRGIFQSRRLLKQHKPDAVFVKGGYVGLPVGLAAKMLKIPLVIHESDSVAGMTNRILGRYARVI